MAGRSTFGSVRKRTSGRWQASYWHEGQHYTGPRTFDAKSDARAWLSTVEADIHRGTWLDPDAGAVTFGAYAGRWLDGRHDLAERSAGLYAWLLARHVLPTFGAAGMAKIKPSAVRSWHAGIANDHPSTAAKAYRLLSQIMRTAVRDRIIAVNPCDEKGAGVEHASERPTASVAEVAALADAMPAQLRIAVLLAAWCQLRRAEIRGMRRRDVDLMHARVTVAVTRTTRMDGETVEKAPKTEAGPRTVAVPPNILDDLAHHLATHVGPGDEAPLLDATDRALGYAWSRARRKVGRPDLRVHDLRHSGLTWAAATGATVAELMRRAGHKSSAAALRYQHATEDRDQALAAAMAELAPVADVVPITGERTD